MTDNTGKMCAHENVHMDGIWEVCDSCDLSWVFEVTDNKQIVRHTLERCQAIKYNETQHKYINESLKALDNLYDKAALIEKLEGMKIVIFSEDEGKIDECKNQVINEIMEVLKNA